MALSPNQAHQDEHAAATEEALTAAESVGREYRRLLHELAGLVDGSLRSVQSATSLLERQADAQTIAATLAAAQQGLRSLADLVRAARSGQTTWTWRAPEQFSLRESLWDSIELVRPSAGERSVTLDVEIDASLASVPPLPISPVITNALRNAVEASSPGDRISVRASCRGGTLCLRVLDEGMGLPDGADERSPFREGFTTKVGGSGIGLAICQEIVNNLGGFVALRNRDDGQRGCAFVLDIPLPRAEHAA